MAALYILIAYQKIFPGPVREDLASTKDLNARELWVVGPLIALMLVFGFYPKPALDTLRGPAQQTVQQAQHSEPAAVVDVLVGSGEEGGSK
jgi:NADH-quinone oxidoreductase subunit M